MHLLNRGIALLLIAVLTLIGCGGGGDSAPPATTLSGTAAVGYPIVNGAVTVTCAAGAAVSGIPNTSATGAWSVSLSGQTLPCAVQVAGGTISGAANTVTYQSIANAYGTVNVTPLTGLVVANLAGAVAALTQTQLAAFNTATTPLATQLNTALVNLRTTLGLTALNTINPITTAFNPASGVVMDDILSALQTAMNNATVTYANLLAAAGASPGAAITLPTGLTTTALNTAYAGTTSGGGGTGGTTPTVTGFSPATGAVGTTVTITGTNLVTAFPPAPLIKFDAFTANVTGSSNTSMTVIVPTGLALGAHTITIGGATGTPLNVGNFNVTSTGGAAPAAPTGVTATLQAATVINVGWTAVSGATAYNVYRSTTSPVDTIAGNRVTTPPIADTGFGDFGLTAATTYYYKVRAINATGESADSAEVSATTSALATGNVCVIDTTAPLGTGGNYNYKQCYVNRPTGYSCDQVGMGGVASKYHAQYGYPSGSIATFGFSMQVSCPAPATTFDMGSVFVSTFAGGGGCLSGAACGYLGSGGLAGSATLPAGIIGYLDSVVGTNALFSSPEGITSDGTNLYVADADNYRIRKVVIATGEVSTFAGAGANIYGNPVSIDGIGTFAYFLSPQSITTNGTDLFVVEQGGTVRKINLSTKAVTTLPIYGVTNIASDATNLYVVQAARDINQISIATGVSTNLAMFPVSTTLGGMVTVGSKLYVTDSTEKIWVLDLATKIYTLLMNPNQIYASAPGAISTDGIYLYTTVGQNTTIRKTLIATGTFTSVIKSPNSGFLDGFGAAGVGYSSVGGQMALFYSLRGIAAVGGNLYVTDGARSSRIRKIAP
ncbi:MAG: hypothetical protein ABL911_09895 [Gallionella sp.]